MLTQERLKQLLDYSPDTGLFYWRVNRRRVKAGDIAGSIDKDGYILVKLDQVAYRAHRLAFYFMIGRWPPNEVDHIDLDKINNKWGNLREATKQENMRNLRPHRDNKAGLKGVYFSKRRYRFIAQARVWGKTKYLGQFENSTAAHHAYVEFIKREFGDFARAS